MLSTLSVASALIAIASAQSASTTVSQSMPPSATAGFNPGNVTASTAFLWCHAQQNSCPEICGGQTSSNTCDPNTFTYSCVCLNGTEPDVTAFEQTLPFYICQETYQQCINSHPNDAEGQSTCKNDEVCGTRNATSADSSSSGSSSSSASASSATAAASSSAASGSGSPSASASSATSSSSSSFATSTTPQLATGAIAAILLAACKLFL